MKPIMNFLFNARMSDLLISVWTLAWFAILTPLRANRRVALVVLKSGVAIHKVYYLYWTGWFRYYLARDTCWAETWEAIKCNPWCPDSVAEFYREMLFGMDPKRLGDTFAILPGGARVKELYKARQARCGFASLV